MNFEKHKWWYLLGAYVLYLWWNGSLASIGLPSAWVLNPIGVATAPSTVTPTAS